MSIFSYWPEAVAILALIVGYRLLIGQPSWQRLGISLIFFVCLSVILYGTLGNPKPMFLQYQDIDGDLIAYYSVEGNLIYLYYKDVYKDAPQSIVVPWSREVSDTLDKEGAYLNSGLSSGSAGSRRVHIFIHHGDLGKANISLREIPNAPAKD